MSAARKIGVMGGSFDPPHLGHLVLAQDAAEHLALDAVIFVPAAQAPLKPGPPASPAATRLEMTRAAVAAHGDPAWSVSDLEIRQGGKSYTIHTAQRLRELHPGADVKLYWLIGADQLRQLGRWHRAEELFQLVDFAVADREAAVRDAGNIAVPPGAHVTFLPTRNIDISSTEIRRRLRDALPVDFFLPAAVHQIIEREHLYR
jgi:nicotinate-nucleotide adenylyltransferase